MPPSQLARNCMVRESHSTSVPLSPGARVAVKSGAVRAVATEPLAARVMAFW